MRIALLCALLAGSLCSSGVRAQEGAGPIDSERLLQAVKTQGLSATELTSIIKRRGLSFEMSADLERKYREAGAGNSIIDVLWEKENWSPPAGPPLNKDVLITLLQTGLRPSRIAKMIILRKVIVDFVPTTVKELQSAGASDQLIVLVTENNTAIRHDDGPKPNYDQLIAKAQDALKNRIFDVAESQANAAQVLDASRPEAHSIIGFVYLYHFSSFSKAAAEYRLALDNRGEVQFQVRHLDHITKLGKIEMCDGWLTIKKGTLAFRSNRADHNLSLTSKQIVEARLGGGTVLKIKKPPLPGGPAIHIFIARDDDKPLDSEFRAAREKNQKEEEEIIVDLINAYR